MAFFSNAPASSAVWAAALVVGGMIFLIARLKIQPFIALATGSLVLGLVTGVPLNEIARAFTDGVGATLASVAMVIALGAVAGALLAESGGAARLAQSIVALGGGMALGWATAAIGFIVGLPVFFAVGLVLLIPIISTLARQSNTPFGALGLPLVAGLSVAHGFVPPHPGPVAAIGIFERAGATVDMGKTIVFALLAGIPTVILTGPFLGAWMARRLPARGPREAAVEPVAAAKGSRPGLWSISLTVVLLPIALMLLATLGNLTLPAGHPLRPAFEFAGNPTTAMLAAALAALIGLGWRFVGTGDRTATVVDRGLFPIASILLVVAAGGGFGKMLDRSGAGGAVATMASDLDLSPLVMAWLMAAAIRVAIGSATAAITMAAGIIAPVAVAAPGTNMELIVVALGAGSLVASHVNDGGFWLVKEYLQLTVAETLKTWTILETVIGVIGLGFVLLLDAMF